MEPVLLSRDSRIVTVILNTAKLMENHPQVAELDLNPLMVSSRGLRAVDARILLDMK